MTSETIFDGNGNVYAGSKYKYNYDDKSENLICEEIYDISGKTLLNKNEYVYDKNGNLTTNTETEYSYNAKGDLINTIEWQYVPMFLHSSEDNLMQNQWIMTQGTTKEYDNNGRVTKMTKLLPLSWFDGNTSYYIAETSERTSDGNYLVTKYDENQKIISQELKDESGNVIL